VTTLGEAIRTALLTGEPYGKVMATRKLVRDWRGGRLEWGPQIELPDHPSWPSALEVLPPNQMPKRGRGGSARNAIALWHSVAHIEFVAIDLALDMAGRFGNEMGPEFVGDFLSVAADEAMHFAVIERHLRALGSGYTQLPVHGGLWEAAYGTRHDVTARLAVVPMLLEARGLDVTPAMLERVQSMGDATGTRILQRILDDEIRHVAIGTKHFIALCKQHDFEPENRWKTLVARHFRGSLKPPFNDSARLAAGLPREFYAGVA
jgi:uncharacterized ferritin-like protein (DUF455 family)